MSKKDFVNLLINYYEKKTGNLMSEIVSEEDILLSSVLDAFYGKYFVYDEYVLGILYLREDGYDSIVVCTIDKDSENIECWEEIINESSINTINDSYYSQGINVIDKVLDVMEND